MKERIKSAPYFSAYSLKKLDDAPAQGESKNHNKQFSRVIRHVRVLPMAGSYLKTTAINKINIPTAIQPSDKHWFRNYE